MRTDRRRRRMYERSIAAPIDELHAIKSAMMRDYLQMILRTMLTFTAKTGNVQLYDSTNCSLKIVSECGFDQDFLTFFNSTHQGQAACGTALLRRERVVVEDVAASPIFTGTEAQEVMLRAGSRAVQSTPIFSSSGEPLGMISSHYRRPGTPPERELRAIDRLAVHAGSFLERTFFRRPAGRRSCVAGEESAAKTYELFYRFNGYAEFVEAVHGWEKAMKRLKERSREWSCADFVLLHRSNVVAVARGGIVDLHEPS